MTSAMRKPAQRTTLDSGPGPGADTLLEHLRHVARDARCKSYVDLFGACAALSVNSRVAAQAASDVLMRCLSQALGRRPLLYRTGEAETSFDEDWLLALARSLKNGDSASAAFLLHSRVPKHAHRNIVFLLRNVADNFARI